MTEERNYGDRPATVTVGLVDGRTFVGRLARFRPAAADLLLVIRARDGAGIASETPQRIASEQVAYVAVQRSGAPVSGTPYQNLGQPIGRAQRLLWRDYHNPDRAGSKRRPL